MSVVETMETALQRTVHVSIAKSKATKVSERLIRVQFEGPRQCVTVCFQLFQNPHPQEAQRPNRTAHARPLAESTCTPHVSMS